MSYLTIVSEMEEVRLVRSIGQAHASDINGVEFLANDDVVSIGSDRKLKVWDLSGEEAGAKRKSYTKHPYYASHRHSDVLVVGSLGGYVSVFDAKVSRKVLTKSNKEAAS